MHFHIVIPMYNAAPWIEENLRTIQKQTFPHYRCIIIDDLSTDDSVDRVQHAIHNDTRFTLLVNQTKRFSLGNVCKAIGFSRPRDEDIIVLVDADDRLAHYDVLKYVSEVYRHTQCWMTYGSYSNRTCGTRDKVCRPYPRFVVKNRLFRKFKWRASHLKTFKYHLWPHIKRESFTISEYELRRERLRALQCGSFRAWLQWRHIRPEHLLDPSGRYVRRCVDKAITYPLLELAGTKSFFIKDILYLYTCYEKDLQYGTRKSSSKWCQRLVRTVLRNKSAHPCLAS